MAVGLGTAGDKVGHEWDQLRLWIEDVLSSEDGEEQANTGWTDIATHWEEFARTSRRLNVLTRRKATILRYNFVKRRGTLGLRRHVTRCNIEFGLPHVGSAPWERFRGYLLPATVDFNGPSCTNASMVQVSLLPEHLVIGQRRRFGHRFRGYLKKRPVSVRRLFRVLLIVLPVSFLVVGFATGFAANVWYAAPPVLILLVDLLWGGIAQMTLDYVAREDDSMVA